MLGPRFVPAQSTSDTSQLHGVQSIPLWRLAALVALAFSLTFSFGVLEPPVLGAKVLELAARRPNTVLGFVTAGGLLVDAIAQPVVGFISDRTRTRWGRRVPFVILGTILIVASLHSIAFAGSIGGLAAGYLVFQLASNTAQAPWQTLFRERISTHQRGLASGLRAVLEVVGAVLGRLVAAQILGRAYSRALAGVAVECASLVALVTALIVVHAIRAEERSPEAVAEAAAPIHSSAERPHPLAFAWACANRFFFWLGFTASTTFLLFYVVDVLHYPEAAAQRLIGRLTAVIGVLVLAVLMPIGRLTDRVGRDPLVIAAGAGAAVGTLAVATAHSVVAMAIGATLVALSVGTYLSASWAQLTDLVPAESAARYLGIANVADITTAAALARLGGGAMIDALNRATHSHSTGYRAVLSCAAVAFALSSIIAMLTKAAKRAESTAIQM